MALLPLQNMVAVPGCFAVMVPVALTIATLVSELFQLIPEAVISEFVTVAVRVSISPTYISMDVLESCISASLFRVLVCALILGVNGLL